MKSWPFKDPDEVLDYLIDWSPRLSGGEVISTSTWIVPDGITKDTDSKTDTTTTIWLSDGDEGEMYILENHIITNSTPAREMDQSVKIRCKTK